MMQVNRSLDSIKTDCNLLLASKGMRQKCTHMLDIVNPKKPYWAVPEGRGQGPSLLLPLFSHSHKQILTQIESRGLSIIQVIINNW